MQTLGLPPLWAGSLGLSDVNGAKRKTVHKGLYSLAPFSQCSPLACILTVMRTLTPTSRLGLPASPGPWRAPSGNGSDPQSRLHNPQAKARGFRGVDRYNSLGRGHIDGRYGQCKGKLKVWSGHSFRGQFTLCLMVSAKVCITCNPCGDACDVCVRLQ